jgi:hypothetical protein
MIFPKAYLCFTESFKVYTQRKGQWRTAQVSDALRRVGMSFKLFSLGDDYIYHWQDYQSIKLTFY